LVALGITISVMSRFSCYTHSQKSLNIKGDKGQHKGHRWGYAAWKTGVGDNIRGRIQKLVASQNFSFFRLILLTTDL